MTLEESLQTQSDYWKLRAERAEFQLGQLHTALKCSEYAATDLVRLTVRCQELEHALQRAESERDQFKLDNISHRSAVQTLQTYMGLDNTEEGLRACLLAYEAVKAERDKALATCAEMRNVFNAMPFHDPYEPIMKDMIKHALSHDCGKGWLSPEKAKEIERNAEILADDANRRCDSAMRRANESQAQVKLLLHALETTLEENGHLADGEVCTLWRLKKALAAVNQP